MANNEGYIEVISKIKPANRTGFKVADASDIEYTNSKMVANDVPVTNVADAIDTMYDILTAKPTFWLVSDSKLNSDGETRLYVSIQTESTQSESIKLTITNKTTGVVKTMSNLPATSLHNVDLGIISTFGTYEYSVTAVDNFNNPLTVNINKSSSGSYMENSDSDQYELKFYVISGNVKLGITSIDCVDDNGNKYIINGKSNIYSTNVETNMLVKGSIQYPEVSSSDTVIKHSVEYNIYTKDVYVNTDKGLYVSAYKYRELSNRGIRPYGRQRYTNLYYKYNNGYVSINEYDKDETKYAIDKTPTGIFYDFVENTNGDGEFIWNGTDYQLREGNTSLQTYDFVPTYVNTEVYDKDGKVSEFHSKQSDIIQFNIDKSYFLTEDMYTISCKAVITKIDNNNNKEIIERSQAIESNIFPINEVDNNNPNSLKVVPISNVEQATTDDDISIKFMIISSKSGVSTINFSASLYYINSDGETEFIKTNTRQGCKNLEEQEWNIGRVTKNDGHYYYRIEVKSYDNTVVGDTYEYHFNVLPGKTSTEYITDGLIAYWDATTMSNDEKNPDIWYPVAPVVVDDKVKIEKTNNYYIKLYGLNYNINGWVPYNKNSNKHPHLKFTGDSYGLAYRLDSNKNETTLSAIDLIDPSKIEGSSGTEMTFEILFRTRCVGEMKACVLSSRREESIQIPLYTYSDTDSQIANSGLTISYNKAIINSNKEYLTTPYNQDEWKHITFVINRENSTEYNYNPFSSIRIYIDGVLTSIKRIEDSSLFVTENGINPQMVLNAHLDSNIVKDFGTSEIRLIRMYNKALSNNQIVSNYISSIYDSTDKLSVEIKNSNSVNSIPIIHFIKNKDNGINKRKEGTSNVSFSDLMNITEKEESKSSFVNCTMHYLYPNPDPNVNGMLVESYNNIDVYLQGTSTLQFPVKNLKIKAYADAETKEEKAAAKSYKFIPPNMNSDSWVADSTYTLKCDYMESGHLNNTPTAKFYHNLVGKLLDAKIDDDNSDTRPLNKKEYIYTQDNINGIYYLDVDGSYKEIDSNSDYNGIKYKITSEISTTNSGSPSRDYYQVVTDNNGIIHYTSEEDASEEYLHTIDKKTGNIDSVDYPNDANIAYYYNEPNKYYIRDYNSSYTKLRWIEYDPTNESHYGKILYKINTKYRDSIDGFPCIVYYTDDNMSKGTDYNDSRTDLTLLGTMMFNVDKTGKAMGFEISPVYENEYDEYLNSKYIELNIGTDYTLSEFKELWINDEIDSYDNKILKFVDFYYGNDPDNDLYGTIPSYTYDQQYVKDVNGEYKWDEYSEKYILADISDAEDNRFKLVFNDYRTYYINTDTNKELRLNKQCALSYEATTNTKYAAGTFYDITKAYNTTYEDDFLNQYYNEYFVRFDGVTPHYVVDYNNEKISPISIENKEDSAITLSEFKDLLIGEKSKYHMDALIPSEWNKEYFYIDEDEAGPYVYINADDTIGKWSKDNNNGKFVVYDKYNHTIDGKVLDDSYRYKFQLPFKSYKISYEVSDDGEYYKDSDDKYKKIQNGASVAIRYKQKLDDEEEFTIRDKRSYISDKLTADDESYIQYIKESFETRYSYVEENDNINDNIEDSDSALYLAMKNLIKWVDESVTDTQDITSTTKNRFRDEFREHFDLTYAIAYYLQMIVFAQADNAGKNSMWDTWDGKKFYIRPYDMDTQSGLNNKGLFNVPTSAEINIEQSPREFTDKSTSKLAKISNWHTDKDHNRYKSYTTSTSRFWNIFAKAFKSEIEKAYIILRDNGIYTEEFILNFYKSNVTNIIGEKFYNEDMNAKYLSQGDESKGTVNYDYLNLLMGNRIDQFSKWLSERLIFCDTYFNYKNNDTLNSQLTIRRVTTNSVAIGISVFSPQYVKISVGSGKDAVLTAFIDTSSKFTLNGIEYEGTLFTLPDGGSDKEISIYGGGNIKELINIENLQPSTLELANAKKLTKLEISGNSYIENLNLANAQYLRELNISNCNKLTGNLDISNSINLHTLNISKSALSGVTLAPGGNLRNFIANDTTIATLEFINLQQLQNIEVSNSDGRILVNSYTMNGCPLIKSLNFNDYVNINKINISHCNNLSSISIEKNTTLSQLSITSCNNLSVINLQESTGSVLENLDLSTVYGLDALNLYKCKTNSNAGIHVILPFYKDENTIVSDNNIKYSDRWHKLKYIKCNDSDIQSISYGRSNTMSNVIDMSPLDMLTTSPSFSGCKKIATIKGLRYTGTPNYIFRSSSIVNIYDSSIELTSNNMTYLFSYCRNLKNYQTLNIEPYTKGHSGKLTLAGIFYGGYVTSDMLNSTIRMGREYILSEATNPPTDTSSYNCQEYLVRDTLPRYDKVKLSSDKLYVYESGNYRLYDKSRHKDIKITYYKGTDGNYYYNRFGVYISGEIDSSLSTEYISVDSNIYELSSDQTFSGGIIKNLQSSYNVEGTVVKNSDGSTYYRFYNNKWKSSDIYTFYNINTDGLYIDKSCKIPITTIGEELYRGEYYCKKDDIGLQSSERKNRYYKIYNPETDSGKIVYKKSYVDSPTDNYIDSIAYICASSTSPSGLIISDTTFDGLEKCTSIVYSFSSSRLLINPNNRNNFTTAFKKLKSLTDAYNAFSYCNSIYSLKSDMFTDAKKLRTVYNMFANSSNFKGFYNDNNELYYGDSTNGSILPSSITHTSSMFAGCTSLIMENDQLNNLLKGLNNVVNATAMFKGCIEIKHIRSNALADMTSLQDISSMFAGCINLNAQTEDEFGISDGMTLSKNHGFTLFSNTNTYPYLTKANSLFFGCTSLTGFIDKYFFGNATKIQLLGCDYNKGSTNNNNKGGAFANTAITSYHEEFLSKLEDLKDVSCLFAKTDGDTISKNHNLKLNMCGYVCTNDNEQYEQKPGIAPNLFINNTKLVDVSYVFAGNQGLERVGNTGDERLNFRSCTLPNIFRKCPNIEYMIGTFMSTTTNPNDFSYNSDTKEIIKNDIYYIYLRGSTDLDSPMATVVNLDEFFKTEDDEGNLTKGMENLISVESLFENSNYDAFDKDIFQQKAQISSNTFKDCKSLTSTKNMFRDNSYLGVNNTDIPIPIDLLEPCRNTITNVSGMFEGCINMKGILPVGDNTTLIAYKTYLDNIKNDPDVIQAYSAYGIQSLTIDQLFDNISRGLYPLLDIVQYYDEVNNCFVYDKILSFKEYIDRYKNTVVLTGYNKINNPIYLDETYLEPTICEWTHDNTNKYIKEHKHIYQVSNFKTVYIKDRLTKTASENDIGQKKIVDEKLVPITLEDIGKSIDFALFGEIGTYGFKYDLIDTNNNRVVINEQSNGSDNVWVNVNDIWKLNNDAKFIDLRELETPYDLSIGKFVQKTLMVLDIDFDKKPESLNNYQVVNICKMIANEYNGTINETNYKIYRNRRMLPYIDTENNLVVPQNYNNKLAFIINGEILPEYNKNQSEAFIIYPPISLFRKNGDIESREQIYYPGLLGSCPNLVDASSMFAGCTGLYGPIPKDIFSAESPSTYLNSLTDISSMFKGCYLLSTSKNKESYEYGNPSTMYSRNLDTSELDRFGEYLVPEDWLIYTPKIQNISYLFSRVATITNGGTTTINPNIKTIYINGSDGIIFPNSIFANKTRITDASYLLYGSPLIIGELSSSFMRDSLSVLTNISAMFACTSISSIGLDNSTRIFENQNLNTRLTNVSGTFANCTKLTSDNSYAPRFYLNNKFSKISSYKSCFAGTYLLTNVEEAKNINNDWESPGYSYENSSTGYYIYPSSYEPLFMNSINITTY